MAGAIPPIVATLKANISEFTAGMDEAQKKVATLQKTAGDPSAWDKVKASAGTAIMGIGAAATAVGATLVAISGKDEQAHAQLKAAIEASGHSFEDYSKQIDTTIGHEEKYGKTADDTQEALRRLTQATNDPAKALADMSVVTNLAAARHISLSDAAGLVSRVLGGSGGKILKEYGINMAASSGATKQLAADQKAVETTATAQASAQQKLNDLLLVDHAKKTLSIQDEIALRDARQKVTDTTAAHTTAVEALAQAQAQATDATTGSAGALDLLGQKLSGQADSAAGTFSGKLQALKAHVEDMASGLGSKLGPALTVAGPLLAGIGGILDSAVVPSILAATAAALPWILAIGALIAVGYLIYANWGTIWRDLQQWTEDAIHAVTGFINNGIEWIKEHWPLILAILTGPFGLAAYFIIGHFNDIMDFVKGIPGDLEQLGIMIARAIANPFIAGLDFLIRAWDSLQFKTPKIDLGPLGSFGGFTIGVPQIPQIPMLAKGGIITGPTLAMLGEGGHPERVTPLDGSEGPSVHVEVHGNVYGSSGVQELADTIRTTLLQQRKPLRLA